MRSGKLRRKDYNQGIGCAVRRMHLDWYMNSPITLKANGRYFLYMELNRTAHIIAAYEKDRKPDGYSVFGELYVRIFYFLQHFADGKRICLFTDSACTRRFYEHRLELKPEKTVPPDSCLYCNVL